MTDQLPPSPSESKPAEQWSRPDNRFLPIRACDLCDVVVRDASRFGCTPQAIRAFANVLQEVIDKETGSFERRLTDDYARFNPDRETLPIADHGPPTEVEYQSLKRQLTYLLDKANYEELDEVQIARAVMQARSRNLRVRVDPDRVKFLDVWVRGRGETVKIARDLWRPWRVKKFAVPVFKRMVVVARLKGDQHVILKLFKDIPESDVEALLPHAEVTMSLVDRVKLWATGAGTLGLTVSKLLKIAIGFAALWKFAWILLVGLATLGIRAALGYRTARITRDWQRTQHLYFQNLGNNASVLQSLVATVKQEEFKEALLEFLFRHAADVDSATCRLEIEQYITKRFAVQIDFDSSDAEEKLGRLGLWRCREQGRVLPIDEATARLRDVWRAEGRAEGREMRLLEFAARDSPG